MSMQAWKPTKGGRLLMLGASDKVNAGLGVQNDNEVRDPGARV
jgi:hypothetical protein